MQAAIQLAVFWASVSTFAIDPQNAASAYLDSLPITTISGNVAGRPTDLADARAAVLAGNYTSKLNDTMRQRCPTSCSSAGLETHNWFSYSDLKHLEDCEKPMLLDFALFNPVDDKKSRISISACTSDLQQLSLFKNSIGSCVHEGVQLTETTSPVQFSMSGDSASRHVMDATTTLDQLRIFTSLSEPYCNETIKYAYSGNVVIGVYAGSGLANQHVVPSILEKLSLQIKIDGSIHENLLVQMCSNISSRYSFGVFVNTKRDLGSIQLGLQTWKNGSCVTTMDRTILTWQKITYLMPSAEHGNHTFSSNSTLLSSKSRLKLRDEACRTIQVHGGDSCGSLASECGISPDDFTKYNPSSTLCGTLTPGQHVCCSSGKLPDFRPKPDAKGYCHPYLVKRGDSCSSIGAAYSITNDDIEKYNEKTWGWNGCQKLFADYTICLSNGYPPMPATVPNAMCGPQVNNTASTPPGTDLSSLNECPLNACCNIWGQCGTTSEFCTISKSSTGAPGTAAPGENGCISNCGTDIVTSKPPANTFHIAYFEAFDWKRRCLHMAVTDIDTSTYTHIHFSFVTLNGDFSINTKEVGDQLPLLQGMIGIKRIVSVGGWDFSTNPSTYTIFRDAMTSEANRQTLVSNVIKFLTHYDLDGIDWDWEYPDEPDIPGIPSGSQAESIGFFLFLDELKKKMPFGKTVSVTAPASFWYLQHFPIQALSLVVDYIVYMTYDLHGQWDYNNKWASPGCVSFTEGLGNCLRSHINLTETINALSMITKAGVPANMIAVGLSSYGRSFQMTNPSCWTEQCTYTGPRSGAYPGLCTNTSGYISDYEIGVIASQNPSAQHYWDAGSYSNILVFNDTQWVAYMNNSNKATRKFLYPGLNFLGTADWAVDLQSEHGSLQGSGSESSGETIYIDPGVWSSAPAKVVAPPGATLIWPPKPLSTTTTINFPPWTTTVSYSRLTTKTSTLADGSKTIRPYYVWISWLTTLTIPPGKLSHCGHVVRCHRSFC